MQGRRGSRETAYKIIYESSIRGSEALEDLKSTISRHLDDEESREFAHTLIQGWKEQEEVLLKDITNHLDNWDVRRLTLTDKILLMLAIFEMRFLDDIPPTVSMDEAIELAKVYGTAESSKFLNGVLDSFHNAQK